MRITLLAGIFLTIFLFQHALAQEKGKVVVIKDPQLDSLISRRLALNRSGNPGNAVSSSGFFGAGQSGSLC